MHELLHSARGLIKTLLAHSVGTITCNLEIKPKCLPAHFLNVIPQPFGLLRLVVSVVWLAVLTLLADAIHL